MKLETFNEAFKLWSKAIIQKDYQLDIDLELQSKLFEFAQLGDYYYIFNVKEAKFDFISKEIEQVLGYPAAQMSIPFFLSIIHPEDQPRFLNMENRIVEFFNALPPEQVPHYKVRSDYRVKKKNGGYIRILQQIIVLQEVFSDASIRTLGVYTDISDLKKDGKPVLSFIGLNGAPSFTNVVIENVFAVNDIAFTKREKEIMHFMITGFTNRQMAEKLHISEMTVKTHRRNILRKTQCNNVGLLAAKAHQHGWV